MRTYPRSASPLPVVSRHRETMLFHSDSGLLGALLCLRWSRLLCSALCHYGAANSFRLGSIPWHLRSLLFPCFPIQSAHFQGRSMRGFTFPCLNISVRRVSVASHRLSLPTHILSKLCRCVAHLISSSAVLFLALLCLSYALRFEADPIMDALCNSVANLFNLQLCRSPAPLL